MPILEDPQHEKFAQLRAEGVTIDQAYVDAGFRKNRSNASRLNSKEHIKERIKELQGMQVEEHLDTVDSIATMLREDRLAARDKGQFSAAVSATMGLAKLRGLLIDKKEDVTPKRTDEQIDARILELLGPGRKERTSGAAGGKGTDQEGDENSPTVSGHGTAQKRTIP